MDTCKHCSKPLPQNKTRPHVYCSPKCRDRQYKKLNKLKLRIYNRKRTRKDPNKITRKQALLKLKEQEQQITILKEQIKQLINKSNVPHRTQQLPFGQFNKLT